MFWYFLEGASLSTKSDKNPSDYIFFLFLRVTFQLLTLLIDAVELQKIIKQRDIYVKTSCLKSLQVNPVSKTKNYISTLSNLIRWSDTLNVYTAKAGPETNGEIWPRLVKFTRYTP